MAQFTEKAIIDAFARLLGQMPLDKISVRDIVAECKISRNTFYYHFGDVYALLESFLKQEMAKVSAVHRPGDTWYDDLRSIFTYISQNRKRVYNIYHSVNHEILTQYLFQATEGLVREYVYSAAEGLKAEEADLEFICFSYQSMFVGMMLDWLRRGMKGEPVDFLERAKRLLLGNTRRMLEAGAVSAAPKPCLNDSESNLEAETPLCGVSPGKHDGQS